MSKELILSRFCDGFPDYHFSPWPDYLCIASLFFIFHFFLQKLTGTRDNFSGTFIFSWLTALNTPNESKLRSHICGMFPGEIQHCPGCRILFRFGK